MSLPKREELELRVVEALPNAWSEKCIAQRCWWDGEQSLRWSSSSCLAVCFSVNLAIQQHRNVSCAEADLRQLFSLLFFPGMSPTVTTTPLHEVPNIDAGLQSKPVTFSRNPHWVGGGRVQPEKTSSSRVIHFPSSPN